MTTLKGKWKFNENLVISLDSAGIRMVCAYDWGTYTFLSDNEFNDTLGIWTDTIHLYAADTCIYSLAVIGGWQKPYDEWAVIDFGNTERICSKKFYDWFIANAVQLPSETVDITYNGITLASLKSNETATLLCEDEKMRGNIVVTAPDERYKNELTSLIDRSITHLDIPVGVTILGGNAFNFCKNLTSVTIPDGVTMIETSCFYSCTSLLEIFIPDSVTIIGSSAFAGSSIIERIEIGTGVTRIANTAFQNCYALKTFICHATTPPTIQSNSFLNVPDDQLEIYVPAESVEAYKNATNWSNRAEYIKPISGGSDLTNTIWTINNWSVPAGYGAFSLFGSIDGKQITHLSLGIDSADRYVGDTIYYLTSASPQRHVEITKASHPTFELSITGGYDATNPKLIAWIESNGNRVL